MFLRPQNWSRLKTLLLKHYCRRQGFRGNFVLQRCHPKNMNNQKPACHNNPDRSLQAVEMRFGTLNSQQQCVDKCCISNKCQTALECLLVTKSILRTEREDPPSTNSTISFIENVSFVGVLRGNTIRGNTTRNSERKMAL